MSGPSKNPLKRMIGEIHRRSLWQVLAIYAVASWVVFEVVQTLTEGLGLPAWFPALAFVLLLIGLPIVLATAFVQEGRPSTGDRAAGTSDEALLDGEPHPLEEGGSSAKRPSVTEGADTGLRSLFTWRNAILGGLAAFALWGVVAAGWVVFGRNGRGAASSHTPTEEASIAVLPFEALGQDEPGPFTEGMHDDLLTRLSNVAGLKVTSRTSVQQYRGTRKTTRQIAEELGVTWIVEGGVQEMGDQIQVNAQLIDPATDAHAWAESYRRDLTARNLFAIQSELTKRIVRSLEAELSPRERERIEQQPTDNLDAYRLYVQGRADLNRRTEEGMRRAVGFFRQAIREDSSYAPAWAGLADARTLLTDYGYADPGSTLPRAWEAARRALELNPDLADAHASMGVLLVFEHDGPGVLRALQRAVELKPSYAQGRAWLGEALSNFGRLTEALPETRTAAKLDPMSPLNRVVLAYHYLYADSLEKALHEARTAVDLAPRMSLALNYVGAILSQMGRQEEAISTLQRAFEETDPGPAVAPRIRFRLAVAHVRAGDTATARGLLDEIETDSPFYPGLVYAQMGDADSALAALGRTDFNYVHVHLLRYSPVLDSVRDDPRFQELIRQLNQEWGLNPDGSLP